MNMSIKELGEKYGYDQIVYLVILDKDIDQVLELDGVTPGQPDYFIRKIKAKRALQELFNIFIDSLEKITVCRPSAGRN
jgi:hypothetical protein